MDYVTPIKNNPNNGNGHSDRNCGDCRECCILPEIPSIQKGENIECPYLRKGEYSNSCKIYSRRPKECRAFKCLWLEGKLSNYFKPNKCNALMFFDESGSTLIVIEKVQGISLKDYRILNIVSYVLSKGMTVTLRYKGLSAHLTSL